jgi:AAA15 family ATPase/GTPase
MLDTLFVNNYRNLSNFKIGGLERINLVTGKNNTGKSTLLEAISIYAMKGEIGFIYNLLSERGENFRRYREDDSVSITESNIRTISSLFANRIVKYGKEDSIIIGTIEATLFGDLESSNKAVRLRFVKFIDEVRKDFDGNSINRRSILEGESNDNYSHYKIGLETTYNNSSRIISLEQERPNRLFSDRKISEAENLQYVRTRNVDREINGKLWDNITLTEKEKYVIEALQVIEPSTERIAFIEENGNERTAVIKLSNSSMILPLRSMGDGVNRILTIVLALINADNGYLLIDEFENGLHYTVQEKLWDIIFNLSERLNVQVFVTTHSEDCISGFERVLNSPKNDLKGKLIRLDNVGGEIIQVDFDANELKIATTQNIETR